MFLLEANVLF